MFPNVRLMVVAILAAIAGIGCGLGLFATFRVNHEPLARLAEGSAPLPLAFDNLALGSDARLPLDPRLPVGAPANVVSIPVIVPTSIAAAEQAGAQPEVQAGDQVGADPAAGAQSAGEEPAADVGAGDPSKTASLDAAAEAPEVSSASPEENAAPHQEEATAAIQDHQRADSPPPPSIEQTMAVTAAADDQQRPATAPKAEERKTAKPAPVSRPARPARRVAKTIRARRTAGTARAQPAYQYPQPTYSQSAYSQPTYTWADGTAQSSQPVRRVVVKRHRAAKKAVPAVQSNPPAATAGLSGIP